MAALSYFLVEDVGHDPAVAKEKRTGILKPAHLRTPVDRWGLTFLVVGVGSLQYVLERGHAEDWFDSKSIILCTLMAIASLVSLIWWELKTDHPILNLRYFKNPSFRSGILLMTALGGMLYGLIFVLPVFMSSILGFTAQQTGEQFIPGALCAALCMPIIGMQLRKRDPRTLVLIGVVSLAIGGLLIGRFDAQSSARRRAF